MTVLFSRVNQFKSSAYEIARNVLRSRTQFAEKSEQQAEQIRELNARVEQLTNQSKRDAQLLSQTQQELEQQRRDNEELRNKPIRLPSDLPLPHHTYGPKMIAMCLNLCKEIGFRPTETAIRSSFRGWESGTGFRPGIRSDHGPAGPVLPNCNDSPNKRMIGFG